ncbi:hypothetical protein SDC9_164759 [bioreactor metagenome]|uniref:Uncharacterized protein n=1 Tax=bioreactor metagenome TaxID=1076179 RepID=A0A645FUE8_9ZZZZ
MHDLQALWILAGQTLQIVLENHRAFVPISVEQHELALMLLQHSAQNREHRRDAAPARHEQKIL